MARPECALASIRLSGPPAAGPRTSAVVKTRDSTRSFNLASARCAGGAPLAADRARRGHGADLRAARLGASQRSTSSCTSSRTRVPSSCSPSTPTRGVDVRVLLNSAYTGSANDAAFSYLQGTRRARPLGQLALRADPSEDPGRGRLRRGDHDLELDQPLLRRLRATSPSSIASRPISRQSRRRSNADYDGTPVSTPPSGADLVWSPTTSAPGAARAHQWREPRALRRERGDGQPRTSPMR